jgi:hypothetical protein
MMTVTAGWQAALRSIGAAAPAGMCCQLSDSTRSSLMRHHLDAMRHWQQKMRKHTATTGWQRSLLKHSTSTGNGLCTAESLHRKVGNHCLRQAATVDMGSNLDLI